jgi:hypothetical protein
MEDRQGLFEAMADDESFGTDTADFDDFGTSSEEEEDDDDNDRAF